MRTLKTEKDYEKSIFIDRKIAAQMACVSLPTLDKWIKIEGFPVVKVGNCYRIFTQKYVEWLESFIGKELPS